MESQVLLSGQARERVAGSALEIRPHFRVGLNAGEERIEAWASRLRIEGHRRVLGQVILTPPVAQAAGAQVHNAVRHAEQPGSGVPAFTVVGERPLTASYSEARVDPRPRLRPNRPFRHLIPEVEVAYAFSLVVAVARCLDGELDYLFDGILAPPVARPLQPASALVVIAQTVAMEVGEQLGIAGVGAGEALLEGRFGPAAEALLREEKALVRGSHLAASRIWAVVGPRERSRRRKEKGRASLYGRSNSKAIACQASATAA